MNIPPRLFTTPLTLIGALGAGGLGALMTVEGPTDGAVFRAWTERVLCLTLEAGDVVVIDNLGAHKVRGIRNHRV